MNLSSRTNCISTTTERHWPTCPVSAPPPAALLHPLLQPVSCVSGVVVVLAGGLACGLAGISPFLNQPEDMKVRLDD